MAGSHVVGPIYETDISATADTWNGWINSANLTFDYLVNVPGDHRYVCHPRNPHGEDGYLRGLPKGIYFCTLLRNGVVLEARRLVKQ